MKNKLMIYPLANFCGQNFNLVAIATSYRNNNSLAVELVDADTGESFDVITVNLDESSSLEKNSAYVDVNNSTYALKFLEDNHIASFTGLYGFSGFCAYPMYDFDMSKLNVMEDLSNE